MKFKVFIAIFALVVAGAFGANFEEKIEKTFKLDSNGVFSLKNVNGTISVQTHSKKEVLIKAVKIADQKSELADVDIIFDYKENELEVTVKHSKSRSDVRVNFEAWVPENLNASKAKSVNGEVKIDGLYKRLDGRTVNGKIAVQGSFTDADFDTVNGAIGIYCKDKLAGDIKAKTVNGSIQIEIPIKSGFKFDADTLNGSIKSDFDKITINKGFVGKSATGTIGDGAYKITAKTVNGSIKILKN